MGDILEQLEANTRKRAELLDERDRLIIEGKNARVPVSHLAEAVGLVPRLIASSRNGATEEDPGDQRCGEAGLSGMS